MVNLNITPSVRTALALASSAAAEDVKDVPVSGPPVVEPVHLLAGVIWEGGPGVAVLRQLGVEPRTMLWSLAEISPDPSVLSGSILPQLSPTAHRVLSQAMQAAVELELPYLSPDHLLLGLARVPGARELLQAHGIDAAALEETVRQYSSESSA